MTDTNTSNRHKYLKFNFQREWNAQVDLDPKFELDSIDTFDRSAMDLLTKQIIDSLQIELSDESKKQHAIALRDIENPSLTENFSPIKFEASTAS